MISLRHAPAHRGLEPRMRKVSAAYRTHFAKLNRDASTAASRSFFLCLYQPCENLHVGDISEGLFFKRSARYDRLQVCNALIEVFCIAELISVACCVRVDGEAIVKAFRQLAEYGEVMGRSREALDKAMPRVLAKLSERLPAVLIDTLREQWSGLTELDRQVAGIEHRLQAWMKDDKACQTIAAIPGVGLLSATAAVATMGDAKAFRSGREFAAWLGLVPKQTGSGGKVQLLGISKRGDAYVRTLLIHGARSVLRHPDRAGAWVEQLGKRRPFNVVIVALANKIARTIWALLAHDRQYGREHVSSKPQ